MNFDLLPALIVFCAVAIGTPGPNNMMLLASGANYGMRRSVPHMFGIMFGHAAMVVILGLGLAGLLQSRPEILVPLKYACLAYLFWLAWMIANAAPPGGEETTGRPLTFIEAALFQWVNPKAWAVALSAVTAYSLGTGVLSVLVTACVFIGVSLPSVSIWTGLGTTIRSWLEGPGRLRSFNISMAVLLVLSTLPVVF